MKYIKRGDKLLKDIIGLRQAIRKEKEKPYNPKSDEFRKASDLPTHLEDLEGLLLSALQELKQSSPERLLEVIRDYDADDAEFDEEIQRMLDNERKRSLGEKDNDVEGGIDKFLHQ